MATTHLAGAVELPASLHDATSLDISRLAPVRSCPLCKGDGKGPAYGFTSDDRSTCERCEGRCWERVPCVGCDAPSIYVVDGEAFCCACVDRPWIGPRLTGSTEDQARQLLRLAEAAIVARRVTLPALRLAGEMLARGVARGPVTVVTVHGETVKEVA